MLADFDMLSEYEPLLELTHCHDLTQQQVSGFIDLLENAFDKAITLAKSEFFFSTDISEIARPIAIDASRELVNGGNHREAMFWILATYARCLKIFEVDAPSELESHETSLLTILESMGIASQGDRLDSRTHTLSRLDHIEMLAQKIIDSNSQVT